MRAPRTLGTAGRTSAPSTGDTPATAISIHSLTTAAKNLLEGGIPEVWVKGEITGFRAFRSGHWYFCLKDRMASIDCVVWASETRRVGRKPEDGLAVVARGRLSIWPASGKTQFVIRKIEETGEGAARRQIEETLARLRADGLLAPERKRRLPRFPRRIAAVTSLDGAAMHDIVSVARRRSPIVEVVIVPARVQGDDAVQSLLDALERVNRWRDCDVVILGRGGGGKEDLRAFNDERVARAVAACPLPVISAVGHEIDTTVCDLVADHRAPTPSAAAEAAVPMLGDLQAMLGRAATRLAGSATLRVERARRRHDDVIRRLADRSTRVVTKRQDRIARLAGRLEALSPLRTLSRGYAVTVDSQGRALTTAEAFKAGDEFQVILRDGRVHATADTVTDEPPPSATAQRR